MLILEALTYIKVVRRAKRTRDTSINIWTWTSVRKILYIVVNKINVTYVRMFKKSYVDLGI